MNSKKVQRFHIIIDLSEVKYGDLVDTSAIDCFLRELIEILEMKILYGPVIIEGVPANPGISAFCIIDYSHVSLHTFTETGQVLVDIFSCKEYDPVMAEMKTLEYFPTNQENIEVKVVDFS